MIEEPEQILTPANSHSTMMSNSGRLCVSLQFRLSIVFSDLEGFGRLLDDSVGISRKRFVQKATYTLKYSQNSKL